MSALSQVATSLPPHARMREACDRLRAFPSALVALSGGVDSALTLKLATEALGVNHVVAATARSVFFTQEEMESAKAVAQQLGVRHCWLDMHPLEDADVVQNSLERCYFCKRHLVAALVELKEKLALGVILDGSNAEDAGEFRPGRRALEEGQVYSVLADTGFSKQEVRAAALHWGLPNWDRPQAACLATRIPHGEALSASNLERIARAEAALRPLGLKAFRVRHHGEVARLEIEEEVFARLADEDFRAQCIEAVQQAGFLFVTVDLEIFHKKRPRV